MGERERSFDIKHTEATADHKEPAEDPLTKEVLLTKRTWSQGG